jgi:CheY-like chemotaxis protein
MLGPARRDVSRTELPDFSRLSFLVVEDDRDSRGIVGELLRACGAIVVEAESVRVAKAFVGTVKFDLIVTTWPCLVRMARCSSSGCASSREIKAAWFQRSP